MAIVCPNIGLLFILNPRTASSATAIHLEENYGGVWVPEEDRLNEKNVVVVPRKHTTVSELVEAGLLNTAKIRTRAVAVRNPFDSIVSLWVKKRHTYAQKAKDPNFFGYKFPGFMDDMAYVASHSFNDWVCEVFAPPGTKRSLHRRWTQGCSVIMKYETLQDDFRDLCARLDVPFHPVATTNVTAMKNDYRTYYDDQAKSAIEAAYSYDLDRFGYSFDSYNELSAKETIR